MKTQLQIILEKWRANRISYSEGLSLLNQIGYSADQAAKILIYESKK